MANLFTGADYSFKGKTHTNLVVSEGNAPAEKWVVSKDNDAKPFIYQFGPKGNQVVELAKGKIVEAGPAEFDPATGRKVSTVKQATEGSQKAIGVLMHSVYEGTRGGLNADRSDDITVLTRSYVEVPMFEHDDVDVAAAFAEAMNFGAAYGAKGADALQPGDFVKVGKNGNFVKLDTATDSPFQIVGKVLAKETDLPPAGFLQYYMGMDNAQLEAFIKGQSMAPTPGASGFPYGAPYSNGDWKTNVAKMLGADAMKGIPFLTDGYFRAKEAVVGLAIDDIYAQGTNDDGMVEAVNVADKDKVVVTGKDVKVGEDVHDGALFIKLRHKIDRTETNPIVVKHDGGTLSHKDIHIDLKNNMVVVYLEAGADLKNVVLDAKLVVDPVAGVPTEWDQAGSAGAVRILLQK